MLDAFIGETDEWVEVTKAYVEMDVPAIFAQRQEYAETTQTVSTRKTIAKAVWTPVLAVVDAACRMTFNGRVFHIDQITNPGENNRELQFMVVERT